MRVDGWETVLAEAVDEARGRTFSWGMFDCATWAFDVRCRMTGIDAAQAWRGRYRSRAGAARWLRRMGHANVSDLATAELGAPVAPLMAQRGDIVLAGEALGVCIGGAVAAVSEAGLVVVPLTDAVAAWRV